MSAVLPTTTLGILAVLAVLSSPSCSKDDGTGTAGRACYGNGTCNQGLSCVDGLCAYASEANDPAHGAGVPAEQATARTQERAATPLDEIELKTTVDEAFAYARRAMRDTFDEDSDGTSLFALWAARHLSLNDVSVPQSETSFGLVQKDSSSELGKRMCVTGTIVQIEKVQIPERSVFVGLILGAAGDILRFYAVGSTGTLVANDRSIFCGFVTGNYRYSNSGGGTGHAVALVGLFKIPENMK